MAKRNASNLRILEWLAVIVLGGLLGSTLAVLARELLGSGPLLGFLTRTWRIGLIPPATLDLKVMSLTLGMTLDVGLLTFLGIALSLWLYLRVR